MNCECHKHQQLVQRLIALGQVPEGYEGRLPVDVLADWVERRLAQDWPLWPERLRIFCIGAAWGVLMSIVIVLISTPAR